MQFVGFQYLIAHLGSFVNTHKRCNKTDTHTPSEYVVFIAFALQNGCTNATQCYVLRAFPVLFINTEP